MPKRPYACVAAVLLAFVPAGCGEAGVSRGEFISAYGEILRRESGNSLPGDVAKKLAGCVYDEIRDDVHDDALRAIVNDDDSSAFSPQDYAVFYEANSTCGKKFGDEVDDSGHRPAG
ncbi:MAG: hypothetical protein Q3979_07940 [Actinomycetaceae bacterium]|nr:hypothetical protein [Actinomycetaceae bacterium]